MATPEHDKTWGRISLPPSWQHDHRGLPYINEPFNNDQDLMHWQKLGYTQSRFTGDMYDMRFAEPSWMTNLRDAIPGRNFAWSVYRMRPGDVLPQHSDTYARYCEIYGINDINRIRRYVIFMEDWQSGHYLEMAGTPIVEWHAGDGVYWSGDTPHLAANMGQTDRYTLQITVTIGARDR